MAQPQLAAEQLLGKINISLYADANRLVLERYFRDAKKLLSTDPFGGYMVLGALSSIKFDSEGVINYHKKAIRLHPNDTMGHLNYSVSLHKVGKISEAVAEAKKLCQISPNNPKCWNLYMKLTLENGCISEAVSSSHQWKRLCPNNKNESLSLINSVNLLTEATGIPETDLKQITDFIYSIIEKHKLPIMQHNISFPPNDSSFTFEYQIEQPIPKIADLNDELTNFIINADLSKEANLYFTALFTPYCPEKL